MEEAEESCSHPNYFLGLFISKQSGPTSAYCKRTWYGEALICSNNNCATILQVIARDLYYIDTPHSGDDD